MAARLIRARCTTFSHLSSQDGHVQHGLTAVMHAAHGGWDSWDLVIRLLPRNCDTGYPDLEEALGGYNDAQLQQARGGGEQKRLSESTRKKAILLAEAASGGHEHVIQAVVSAIKVPPVMIEFEASDPTGAVPPASPGAFVLHGLTLSYHGSPLTSETKPLSSSWASY